MFLNLKLWKEDNLILKEEKIPYQKDENKITFQIQEMNHEIDFEKKVFQRENDEFCFYLDLENEKCTYELKTHQAVFDIIVDQSFWDKDEKHLEITYNIETDDDITKIWIDFI